MLFPPITQIQNFLKSELLISEPALMDNEPYICYSLLHRIEDLIKGHIVVGLARGTASGLIILAIALGLILAMQLTGIRGF